MENIFQEILDMYDVHGMVLVSPEGRILFESFKQGKTNLDPNNFDWLTLVDSLGEFQEADLVFSRGRFYIRKTGTGYLMISMNESASMAMVKLSCDIIIPQLAKAKPAKGGLRSFFRR
jgi:hypothetical protein